MNTVAVNLTSSNEGLRLFVYDDATGNKIEKQTIIKGNATIGWGICIQYPNGLDDDEADFLFLYRMYKIENELSHAVSNWSQLSPVRQAVLSDMAYNMGIAGLLSTECVRGVEQENFIQAAASIAHLKAFAENTSRYVKNGAILASDVYDTATGTLKNIPSISQEIKDFVSGVA